MKCQVLQDNLTLSNYYVVPKRHLKCQALLLRRKKQMPTFHGCDCFYKLCKSKILTLLHPSECGRILVCHSKIQSNQLLDLVMFDESGTLAQQKWIYVYFHVQQDKT